MTLRIPLAGAIALAMATTLFQQAIFAQGNFGNAIPANSQRIRPGELPADQKSKPATGTESQPPAIYSMEGGAQSSYAMHGYSSATPCHYNCVDGCGSQGTWGDDCGCESGCCEPDCCNSCGCDDSSWCPLCPGPGQCFFTAEYLNVRANFSQAIAFVDQTIAGPNGSDVVHSLDFGYESSYRFGGGYRLCCCGDEIRFLYMRMSSSATDEALPGDLVPFETTPPPGGRTVIDADVNANSYDIEFAKTIPLGGQCCSSNCGDSCGNGCGDSCGRCCPAWDITWSGGVRLADVDWKRSYTALNTNAFPVTDSRVTMDFQGAGLRAGLEGRRYFFTDGWLSVFAKGNLSLLLGDVEINAVRATDDPTTVLSPDATNTQSIKNRQIIPVTELEAGGTAQLTSNAAFSAGYLMSAWHDLGFRDEFTLNTLLPLTYDDANILGFEGFFARVEIAY